ncbi:hypothetical protein CON23_21190 [Bacillus thuringiensis]|uniref:hypothetical protein n=1 Tax=Bacillus thuringiensis TaxID=1428 RepID=UPI000BEE2A15|nr:hypothetical protein [Bacillus thuringiensis]PEF10233.1 hypothetical protein CON23_21190 [Bacillus thuringiensis]
MKNAQENAKLREVIKELISAIDNERFLGCGDDPSGKPYYDSLEDYQNRSSYSYKRKYAKYLP